LYFCKEHRPEVQKKHGTAITVIQPILSGMWAKVSAQEKKKFEALAAKDKARYEKEKAQYLKDHPEAASKKKASSKKSPSKKSSSKKADQE
jgi:hypothetical protein